jgi:hypothetical protein
MESRGQFKFKPQKEEGITEVRWFQRDHIEPIVGNTFPSIMDVLVKEGLTGKVKEA